jgi:hypothetical protein
MEVERDQGLVRAEVKCIIEEHATGDVVDV